MTHLTAVICPSCKGEAVISIEGGRLRCNNCGYTWKRLLEQE